MNKLVLFVVVAMSVGAFAAPAGAKAPRKKNFVVVEGGYVNDIACVPPMDAGVSPDLDEVSVTCGVGALWDGAWTGHTSGTLEATMDTEGNIAGSYQEWLYGVYLPDGSFGSIHFTGTFEIDGATSVFHAESVIDGGTCAFEGSRGTFTADGHSVHGGYRAEWYRSPNASSADPSCIA
jgi:hypothetical protein